MKRKGFDCYPLTNAQKFHLFYQAFCPKKEVLNIGTSLTIQIDINWNLLKEAIYEAYDRCECMRVRFTKGKDKEWYQYVVDKEDRDIEYVDFTGKTMEEAKAIMTEWTQVAFKRADSPMNRVVMITTPDGYNGLYLLVDHMIMDAQSLILFLSDVIELYCHKAYEGIPYPKDMTSYIEQLKKDLAYEAGCKAKDKDEEFFHKLIEESEPIYADWKAGRLQEQRKLFHNDKLRAAINVTDSVDSALDIFHLEAEPTARLMKFCEEYHISLVCLLMMGLRTYFQKVNDVDDISINTTIARRATIKEKKSGGTRIHSFPFRTNIAKDRTFIEGIYEIRDKQNEMFRHANYNPVEYFAYRSQVYPGSPQGSTYESMSLTYQPMTLRENELDKTGGISYKTVWYPNGATTQAMYLTVMHRPDDNGLDFNFEHQIKAISREEIEYLYYYLCRILFKGIERPNLTIDEIIKLV